MPPICRVGNIAKANTIIPIPPNHCNRALQISIPSERFSILVITVEPVVVIPLIVSKKACTLISSASPLPEPNLLEGFLYNNYFNNDLALALI